MYLSTSRAADRAARDRRKRPTTPSSRPFSLVRSNVLVLGTVSLVTDISSEMTSSALPVYLVLGLGLSPFLFGVLDGVYSGSGALLRLLFGYMSDRWQRRKPVAAAGYALSAVCKLGLLVAGTTSAIGLVIFADRAGKSIRAAPRDALISLSAPPEAQGRAFGLHRAMDTVGALLGPLVAFLLLSRLDGGYHAVFFVSFCVAVPAVVLLWLFVREDTPGGGPVTAGEPKRPALPWRAVFQLRSHPGFVRVWSCAAVLGLVTVSDSFLYLMLQQRFSLPAARFPLLPLGTAAGFLLFALPVGRLADRFGRWQVLLAGHLCLLGAYGVLLTGGGSAVVVTGAVLLLHGIFYAASDGVLMALVAPCLPDRLKATGMGLVQSGQAVARLACSLLFGAAWTAWGQHTALAVATFALAGGLLCALALRPRGEQPVPPPMTTRSPS
ncbi:MFS transporter [Streptomyces sp. NPDC059104]|uniref:MFS transporter n=1 Tax=Streptomyces sp. NPDC059104 TaxID=3346729 RepID=UPI0036890DEB